MKKLCEDMAMSMYREGRLDREIAEAIGYSRVSVTNWRKSRGLPPNRRRRPEKMLDAYKAAMPLERTQELAQAEKDGRLGVLPAKKIMLEYCPMRHPDNCNCTPAGGFCRPDTEICKALHVAYECGLFSIREEAEAALKKREEADNEAD